MTTSLRQVYRFNQRKALPAFASLVDHGEQLPWLFPRHQCLGDFRHRNRCLCYSAAVITMFMVSRVGIDLGQADAGGEFLRIGLVDRVKGQRKYVLVGNDVPAPQVAGN